MIRFSKEHLSGFVVSVFVKVGFSQEHALQAANVLLAADLRGIDSHGVARLRGYLELIKKGRLNPKPVLKVVSDTLSAATVDADLAAGLVSAPFAMQLAIEKAKITGVGMVSVKNSNHFGIAASHAMMALQHDMVGAAFTNASPLVVPTYSIEKMLGTNPICYAFPAKKHDPIVIDLATSAAANGKLEIAERKGKDIPTGWAVDENGLDTIDAGILKKGGSLLPLGSNFEMGSHKGYALSSLVDLLSGVISGANFGPWVPPFPAYVPLPKEKKGEGIGHFFMAFRVDAFRPKDEYFEAVDTWIERFSSAKALEGKKVIVPGEPEMEAYHERMNLGIPLNEKVLSDLKEIATEYQLEFN